MDRFEAVVIAVVITSRRRSVADAGSARPEDPGCPCSRYDRRESLVWMHSASH
jgi:hypothetical protein